MACIEMLYDILRCLKVTEDIKCPMETLINGLVEALRAEYISGMDQGVGIFLDQHQTILVYLLFHNVYYHM